MAIPTYIEISGAIFRKAKFVLNNSRIKTLGSDPLIVIPAPGPNTAINILAATLSVHFVSGYTTGGNVAQLYLGSSVSSFFTSFDNGMFTSGTNLVQITSANFTGNDDLANVVNQPLNFSTEGNVDYTGGSDENEAILEVFFHLFDV